MSPYCCYAESCTCSLVVPCNRHFTSERNVECDVTMNLQETSMATQPSVVLVLPPSVDLQGQCWPFISITYIDSVIVGVGCIMAINCAPFRKEYLSL